MFDTILRLVITIFCLGFVVLVHEWGHFLVARRLGVRVEKFTIGFGKEIFGWTRGDTRYAVCILPLGGMVKMAGEYLEENDPPSQIQLHYHPLEESGQSKKTDEFFSQPWYGRATIALAGPVMNYVLAFVLFAGVAMGWGSLKPSAKPIIGDVIPGLPAAQAQLKSGDIIRSIDGTAINSWEQMANLIHEKPEQKLNVVIERGAVEGKPAQVIKTSLTPQKDPTRGMGLIGIMPQVDKVKVGFADSIKISLRDIKAWTLQPLNYIAQKVRSWEGPKELSGPIGIATMVSKATKEGVAYVIYLMAVISVGLGLFNLFPIPVLDGGHIFLYLIEGLIRRPLSRRTLQVANAVGLSLILTIFLYATYQDVLRWRLGLFK